MAIALTNMDRPFVFPARTMNAVWAISFLTWNLVELVGFLEYSYYELPEGVRRLISHFGTVRLRNTGRALEDATGVDFTNCIYALVWRLLLEEAPGRFRIQRITRPIACGNMLESLMAIAFFGPVEMGTVRRRLGTQQWAGPSQVDLASRFLQWANTVGWQEYIAGRIPALERMVVLVHHVCRVENPYNIFHRLSNRELDRRTLEEYVANIDAMRLGWGSAQYAVPGRVRTGSRAAPGDLSTWVIWPHPHLTEKEIDDRMARGARFALSHLNLSAVRFLAPRSTFECGVRNTG